MKECEIPFYLSQSSNFIYCCNHIHVVSLDWIMKLSLSSCKSFCIFSHPPFCLLYVILYGLLFLRSDHMLFIFIFSMSDPICLVEYLRDLFQIKSNYSSNNNNHYIAILIIVTKMPK